MTEVANYYTLQKRPRSVTIMIWGVFLIGLANGWRAVGLVQQSELLLSLASSLNPWVGSGLALFWGVVLIGSAVFLWFRKAWTRPVIPGLILAHGLYNLALVLLFARSTPSKNALPAMGLLFVLAFVLSIWALNRPSVRWYFQSRPVEATLTY